ncbi:hypothetical protein EJ05DRAFT_503962 [Pseudovirgaria hyperparasitica]|uniref:EamA domain-containing protein n=1 Tax=Pseudovirgaria hyperparasitica TaxID=470096 RepID=A0A6A6VX88_9PEZI|nr:uncharacterized protein EJ05DRAFT_503962 [Pseudovirgaria hyperparasitica]KAF2754426.1 hypothetical protein EJ05DRAFT_503962 [Pseudovirgaria hyperparasitica]
MSRKVSKSSSRYGWLPVAIASGAFAAVNGVFAKLTTTNLTSTWAFYISTFVNNMSIPISPKVTELLVRGLFLALNTVFNGVMWGLFTRALTLANSTVQVTVINTCSNFLLTALLGRIVFTEALPPLWWVGAAMLVAGSVIIGIRDVANDESKKRAECNSTTTSESLIYLRSLSLHC